MSQLSKLALGTWLMGGTKDPDPQNDDAGDVAVIQLALDNGITLIDTAQNYAGGKCEEIVRRAIKDRPRDSYQILTKQSKDNLSFDGVIQGCHDSMKRLGVEYIDYFVCHAPNTDYDMKDFFKAVNQLHKEGFIQQVGVSNFGPKMLELAISASKLPIALNQVSFSVADADILTSGTYDFCTKHGIPIQAFRTLVDIGKYPDITEALQKVAEAKSLTNQQMALAYINSYKNMHFTLRASSKEHWDQIKAAMDVQLAQDEIEQIRIVHQNKHGGFGDFLLV